MKDKIKEFIKGLLFFLGFILVFQSILLVFGVYYRPEIDFSTIDYWILEELQIKGFELLDYEGMIPIRLSEVWILFIGGGLIGYLTYYIREKTKKEEEYWKKEKEKERNPGF